MPRATAWLVATPRGEASVESPASHGATAGVLHGSSNAPTSEPAASSAMLVKSHAAPRSGSKSTWYGKPARVGSG